MLLDKGAIAHKEVEVAQDAEAAVDVETAPERIRVLGADLNHPSALIDLAAPISGVIVEQNITAAAGVKTLDNSPNLFTIADLSQVWIICDVYENDLAGVHEGELADIRLNAYPDRVLHGRVNNIGPILDPNLRTAKVRLQVAESRLLRLGMFVTATFHGQQTRVTPWSPPPSSPPRPRLGLPARRRIHLPPRGSRRRPYDPPDQQEILTGLKPGDRVVSNALVLQNTAEQ